MREFTKEEKELIINTPITQRCFERPSFNYDDMADENYFNSQIIGDLLFEWNHNLSYVLENLRQKYLLTHDERIFEELVRLLPNSYKVVKLC